MSQEAETRTRLDPTPSIQDIEAAKPIVLEVLRPGGFGSVSALVLAVYRGQAAGQPFYGFPISLGEHEPMVVREHYRWATATLQALYDLRNAGLVHTSGEATFTYQIHVFPTEKPDHSPLTFPPSGWRVHDSWMISLRGKLEPDRDFLFDADLFIQRANLAPAHQRVRSSLREAVASFRQGLYLASATMIGSASEGAWLEFFEAFAAWAEKRGMTGPVVDMWSVAKHVVKLPSEFKGVSGFTDLLKANDVSDPELKALVVQYDYFRDVRNYAAHFDTTERFDLTYAGVGVMLLEAARYFSTLYRVTSALRA